MTREFNERVIGLTRRACMRTFAAADRIAEAGGKMVTPIEWGRHAETVMVLNAAATELRAALGLVGAAIEALEGETKGEAA